MAALRHLNTVVFFQINEFARNSAWLHSTGVAYAAYGVVLFVALLGWGLVASRHSDARSLAAVGWAGCGTLVAVALNQPIGNVVQEARPYVTHPHALLLVSKSSDFSFPSDHAVMAGAVAAGLLIAFRWLGMLASAAAVLLAVDRVYVGAHYPADVLAGLVVGALVICLGWWAMGGALTRAAGGLRSSRLRPILVAERPADAA